MTTTTTPIILKATLGLAVFLFLGWGADMAAMRLEQVTFNCTKHGYYKALRSGVLWGR